MYQDGTGNDRLEEAFVKGTILTCELAVRKREKSRHKAYLYLSTYVLFMRLVMSFADIQKKGRNARTAGWALG